MFNGRGFWKRLFAISIGALILLFASMGVFAQDDTGETPPTEEMSTAQVDDSIIMATLADVETVQENLDLIWILLAGFLVFFMQAGFAMLEGGFIRQTGVVNSLAENFMDACVTGILFFIVGYGIAYGGTGSSLVFPEVELALGGIDGTGDGDGALFVSFFFQFAFAGAAATIATGAMAERTNFVAKLIYSGMIALFIYPIVVFWTWGGGWLADLGFLDFAGSTIVHQTGGIIALVGAFMVGPRVGRVFGNPPKPSNLALASLGTFILWFGWYGFNVGSTLGASDPNQLGLVVVNTTLAATMGALSAMFFVYLTKGGKWDLPFILNGSLAGLVGITAGCAFVNPIGAIVIGGIAGVAVVVVVDLVERAKIDDAVGAFAVHGACGALGTLMIGLLGVPALTGTSGGLLMGGNADLLIDQLIGVGAVAGFVTIASVVMFSALKMAGILRMSPQAEAVGIDAYEHSATVWPDVLPLTEPTAAGD